MADVAVHRGLGRAALALVALGLMAVGCSSPRPPASPGGGAIAPSGAADQSVVGTWTVEITKADLAAAGITDPNAQNENSGRFTWTFAPDGSWTNVQESPTGSPIINPVFRGTWVVAGATLVSTTTFPAEYADSGLHYTWSIAGDELRLDLMDPPDPVLPVLVETHPWKRTG